MFMFILFVSAIGFGTLWYFKAKEDRQNEADQLEALKEKRRKFDEEIRLHRSAFTPVTPRAPIAVRTNPTPTTSYTPVTPTPKKEEPKRSISDDMTSAAVGAVVGAAISSWMNSDSKSSSDSSWGSSSSSSSDSSSSDSYSSGGGDSGGGGSSSDF